MRTLINTDINPNAPAGKSGKPVGTHERLWTAPASDGQVTAVSIARQGCDLSSYGSFPLIIRLTGEGGRITRVSPFSPWVTPLKFPILFPHGHDGYWMGLKKRVKTGSTKEPRRISSARYAAFHLHERKGMQGEVNEACALPGQMPV